MADPPNSTVWRLEDVLSTEELARRPGGVPDYAAENAALAELVRSMAESPNAILQKLADTALVLCGADSSGISLAESEGAQEVFRWHATAGVYTQYLRGTMPRHFSPCATVLERNAAQLMTDPVRFFPYMSELCSPVCEVLLVPFYRGDAAIGTIWVVAHSPDKHFDSENLRLMTSLSRFASAAVQTLNALNAAETAVSRLRAADAERERLLGDIDTERGQLAEIFQHAPSFMCILLGKDYVVERANDRYLHLVGQRDPVGRSLREALPELEGQGFFEMLDRVFITGEAAAGSSTPLRLRRAGDAAVEEHFIDFVCQAQCDAAGATMSIFMQGIDVTDRIRAEREQRQLAEALREQDQRKDEFLATLAHELRNPLAPISNALQIWPLIADDPQQVEATQQIMSRQVRQLSRLVDDLLDVSRISQGKIELRKEPVALAAIVDGALETVRPLIAQCEHELTVELPAEPIMVCGDHARLVQIAGNLIHNAAKYTDRRGHIWVTAERQHAQAVLRVRDNGAGIPPEMLGTIFGMFAQVDRTLHRAHGGLGIGLTLVRRLVELHGGSVEALSEGPGRGSEFIIRLPIEGESRQSDPQELPAPSPAPTGPHAVVPRSKFLVVDDLKSSADFLVLMLRQIGQEAIAVYDGQAAIEAVNTFQPDAVISDIAMPGMDGYELAAKINDRSQRSPVLVALTGYGQEEDRRKAFAAGFDRHLIKPTTLGELAELARAISQSSTSASDK